MLAAAWVSNAWCHEPDCQALEHSSTEIEIVRPTELELVRLHARVEGRVNRTDSALQVFHRRLGVNQPWRECATPARPRYNGCWETVCRLRQVADSAKWAQILVIERRPDEVPLPSEVPGSYFSHARGATDTVTVEALFSESYDVLMLWALGLIVASLVSLIFRRELWHTIIWVIVRLLASPDRG